jgi:hypothetical protein
MEITYENQKGISPTILSDCIYIPIILESFYEGDQMIMSWQELKG